MSKWSSTIEKCATCDFWGGNRESIQFGNYVEVESNERGSCNLPHSSSRLLENKNAVWSCSEWKKWGCIK